MAWGGRAPGAPGGTGTAPGAPGGAGTGRGPEAPGALAAPGTGLPPSALAGAGAADGAEMRGVAEGAGAALEAPAGICGVPVTASTVGGVTTGFLLGACTGTGATCGAVIDGSFVPPGGAVTWGMGGRDAVCGVICGAGRAGATP
jgi:hypothetical protein